MFCVALLPGAIWCESSTRTIRKTLVGASVGKTGYRGGSSGSEVPEGYRVETREAGPEPGTPIPEIELQSARGDIGFHGEGSQRHVRKLISDAPAISAAPR